jgi:hypothetical protein
MITNRNKLIAVGVFAGAWLWASTPAFSHCDTLDGPVVAAAKTALERKDITPVLKWIKREHEAELKTAFVLTLNARVQGKEARELADQFFFETLVRVHRAGEGAPYTGLKPAATKMEPAVEATDRALESGKADALIKTVTDEVATGLRQRFADAIEKKKNAGDNVEAGREFVSAYVELVHYIEALHATATRPALAHEHDEAAAQPARVTHEHNH